MPKKPLDLTNRQFGKLKAIKQVGSDSHGAIWLCECKCGNFVNVRCSNLLSGHTSSCKCKCIKKPITTGHKHLSSDPVWKKSLDMATAARHYASGTYVNRIKSKKMNRNNTSGIKGVTWDKKQGKWIAYINFRRKMYYLGAYMRIKEAAFARKQAEAHLHDKFVQWWEERNGQSQNVPSQR